MDIKKKVDYTAAIHAGLIATLVSLLILCALQAYTIGGLEKELHRSMKEGVRLEVRMDRVEDFSFYLRQDVQNVQEGLTALAEEVERLAPNEEHSGKPLHETKVKYTYYLPTQGSKEGKNALGKPAKPGRTVAVSRDLAKKGWLGRRVYIPGVGVRIVEDVMHKDIKGPAVDICMPNKESYGKNFVGFITTID